MRRMPAWRRPGLITLPSWTLNTLGIAALALLVGTVLVSRFGRNRLSDPSIAAPSTVIQQAAQAERVFARAASLLGEAKAEAGIAPDPSINAADAGLIGAELTPLVTTLGNAEAKSIAARPLWARVIAIELHRAGVGAGDLVAASYSGSFPGLNLAVTAAAQALGARVAAVSSVTSSSWGANQPGFTWPEMEARLVAAGLIAPSSIAVSAGGAADGALDLEPDARVLAVRIRDESARRLGVPVIDSTTFEQNVQERIAAYERASRGSRLRAYVNVGGHNSSIGESHAILRQRSGWLGRVPFDVSPRRGIVARMAERGVPVLHLLNIRDLALRWGII